MADTVAIGGKDKNGLLETVKITRRAVGKADVGITVEYCGMCHSDLHTVRQEWGPTKFPCVPGHEIVGIVSAVGESVTKFKVGDRVGVGCFVDSCRSCDECKKGDDNYCCGPRPAGGNGAIFTYGTPVTDGTGHTFGGYSTHMVVDENYVLRVPLNLDAAAVAPLLCAGITMYSPMKHYGVKSGDKVAVLGLGGLGHMGVKFAAAMGCEVTVLSRSLEKKDLALKLGAKDMILTTNKEEFNKANRSFDFILDTISADHDINAYAGLLKTDGTIIIVGGVPGDLKLRPSSLFVKRCRIAGSMIGSIVDAQEMLDYCGKHNIVSDIELVNVSYANKAYERMLKSDVFFRFVLDIKGTLKADSVIDPLPSKSAL